MVVIVGDGSKMVNVLIEDVRFYGCEFNIIGSSPTDDEMERREGEFQSFLHNDDELVIDDVHIPASSITRNVSRDKKHMTDYPMKTSIYHFVLLSDIFPVQKSLAFYRHGEKNPSFHHQVIFTGINSLGRDYEYIRIYKPRTANNQ